MRVSLRTKTIVGVAAIEAVLLIALLITAIGFLTEIIDETLTKRATSTASLFATTTKDAILSYDLASLESFSEELMKNSDIAYVKVIGPNGQLFADRGDEQLIQQKFIEDRRLADVSDGIFDTYATIKNEQFEYGRVEIGISIKPTQAAIAKVKAWSISIATIELVLVGLFSFLLGSYLTRQLKTLTRGSYKIKAALKSRDFSNVAVELHGHDELSDLALSFNRLLASLQQELETNQRQQEELENLNSHLEAKVSKRTEALSAKNEELVKVNQEIKETQQQLLQAEKMASVGQLAAGVAHEINNPVGFVSSNLSILKDYVSVYQLLAHQAAYFAESHETERSKALLQLQDLLEKENLDYINQDVNELLEESTDGLQRVIEIVQGLKLFSRVDTDEKQLFDVNVCLKSTLNMVNNELKYHCAVDTDFGALPKIHINVGKLNQVFTNTLLNASQAIASTGTFGQISIRTMVEDQHIVIRISDTGTGIPADVLNKIFNPFFTTKPEGSGTGLGLSISAGIIADHGGEISAESEFGKGCCFTIRLPISPMKGGIINE